MLVEGRLVFWTRHISDAQLRAELKSKRANEWFMILRKIPVARLASVGVRVLLQVQYIVAVLIGHFVLISWDPLVDHFPNLLDSIMELRSSFKQVLILDFGALTSHPTIVLPSVNPSGHAIASKFRIGIDFDGEIWVVSELVIFPHALVQGEDDCIYLCSLARRSRISWQLLRVCMWVSIFLLMDSY